ncbi:MAG: hypothetical protein WA826_08030 [Silvibacterium sp.]
MEYCSYYDATLLERKRDIADPAYTGGGMARQKGFNAPELD